MYQYKYKISFAIRHPFRSLSDIHQKFIQLDGFVPGTLYSTGENRVTPKGTKLEGTYKESLFAFTFFREALGSETKELAETISELISRLDLVKGELEDLLISGGSIELIVGLFVEKNSGFVFRKDLIKELGEFGFDVSFDIYPPDLNKISKNLWV